MKLEGEFYLQKLIDSISKLQYAFCRKIEMEEDLSPTFELRNLPFQVKYCHSILFSTNIGALKLSAVQTGDGMNVLWMEEDQSERSGTLTKLVNEMCKNVSWQCGYKNLPFKLEIQFESISIAIYAAEIYDNEDASVRFAINDEMLLVFESGVEAAKFDSIIDNA